MQGQNFFPGFATFFQVFAPKPPVFPGFPGLDLFFQVFQVRWEPWQRETGRERSTKNYYSTLKPNTYNSFWFHLKNKKIWTKKSDLPSHKYQIILTMFSVWKCRLWLRAREFHNNRVWIDLLKRVRVSEWVSERERERERQRQRERMYVCVCVSCVYVRVPVCVSSHSYVCTNKDVFLHVIHICPVPHQVHRERSAWNPCAMEYFACCMPSIRVQATPESSVGKCVPQANGTRNTNSTVGRAHLSSNLLGQLWWVLQWG